MKSKLAQLEEQRQSKEQKGEKEEQQKDKVEQIKNQPIQQIQCTINFTIAMTVPIQKDQMVVNKYKAEFIDNISRLAKYNNPFLLQYYGIEICDPSLQVQENWEKKQSAKEQKNEKEEEYLVKQTQVKPQANIKGAKEDKKTEKKIQSQKNIKKPKQIKNQEAVAAPNSEIQIKLLAEPRVKKWQISKFKGEIKSKQDFAFRISTCCQVIEAISFLHQLQQSFFPNNIDECLMRTQNNLIKVAPHMFAPWGSHSEEELKSIKTKQMTKIKKQALVNRSLKFVCPEFLFQSITLKDVRSNDVWKLGLFILTILSGQDFKDQLNVLQNIPAAKIKQHKVIIGTEPKMAKIKKYMKNDEIQAILKALNILPQKRPSLSSILSVLSHIKVQMSQSFSSQLVESAKKKFLEEDSLKSIKFLIQLKTNQELFTADLRKKVMDYFKIQQNRVVKEYKLFYRASHSKFSVRLFYQAVFERRELLIILQEKKENKKIIVFSEEAFDESKCNGVFGGYVRDSKKLSFIYSPQQNQFCKLRNADKAIGVSYVQGPIIGDGDIVLSEGGVNCSCRFPLSYESSKLKKLLAERFQLLQYDIYQVSFVPVLKPA